MESKGTKGRYEVTAIRRLGKYRKNFILRQGDNLPYSPQCGGKDLATLTYELSRIGSRS